MITVESLCTSLIGNQHFVPYSEVVPISEASVFLVGMVIPKHNVAMFSPGCTLAREVKQRLVL